MTTSRTSATAFAALTLAAAFAGFASPAQAHHFHRGWGIGAGFVAGTLIGATAATYPTCRYVDQYNRWGNYVRTVKICDVVPY